MRVLIDMKFFDEVDQDIFQPTAAAALFTYESPMAQIIIHLYIKPSAMLFALLMLAGP